MLSIFIWYTPNPFNAEAGVFMSKWIKVPEISVPDNTRYDFMKSDVKADAGEQIEVKEPEVIFSSAYTEAMHHAHYPAMFLSLFVAGLGILFAFTMYQWKKISADNLAEKLRPLYLLSLNKWYFDEFYDATFVAGTIGLSKLLAWFDLFFIDGIVNGSATVTKALSMFSGKFDNVVVDGLVNFMAYLSGFVGLIFRRFQTGKVQTYIVLVIFSLVILLFLFKSF
jgi:NADH-quinone oxidoreductase subunit L